MASIASWIYDKPLRGNYTFTHDEVAQAFSGMSAGSIARALTREVSKGRIVSPLRGFYVIVPDAARGCAAVVLFGRHDAPIGTQILCGYVECGKLSWSFASGSAAVQRDDRASRHA